VKDKVRDAVKEEKAKTQLEQKAKDLVAGTKTPGELKAAAEKLGLEAKAEANYKIATPLGEAGSSVLIDDPCMPPKRRGHATHFSQSELPGNRNQQTDRC
jgi:hypothetical protein